jgi:hypothetical protein
MAGKCLAWTIVVVSALAAVGYAFGGDWRRAIYWAAAAVLATTVTVEGA